MEENIYRLIDSIPDAITNQLQRMMSDMLEKTGLFFRVFARRKTSQSVMIKNGKKHYNSTYKMQDLFGVRIALYFKDDISACIELVESKYTVVDKSIDEPDSDCFRPVRLNYVCKLPNDIKEQISMDFWEQSFIDDTFEIQIRTVFSEGWHEIEHDLRYKCKSDWNDEEDSNRALNGIFATLETCDWSIISMFDQLAHKKYKNAEWESMLRNKLRLRFAENSLNVKIMEVLNSDREFAKELLRLNRAELIVSLSKEPLSSIPKSLDNIVYISNELFIHNETIMSLMPPILKDQCSKVSQ